jgi:hypothetical protein
MPNMRKTIFVGLFTFFLATGIFAQTIGPIQSATVTLSSAQLLHLKGTPVQLVAAPGAGKTINAISAVLEYEFNNTAYISPAGGGGFEISFTGETTSQLNGPAVGFIDRSSNSISQLSQGGPVFSQANAENAALIIRNVDGAEWTNGDGTVSVTVYYTIVSLQ